MNISDAIQILRKHNISGASVLRITEGKATEHELLDYVLNACDQFIAEREEYKRLLKAAVEDFARVDEVKLLSENTIRPMLEYTNIIDIIRHKWRYADEALRLIGETSV